MRQGRWATAVVGLLLAVAPAAGEPAAGAPVWERLKSLVGTWEATTAQGSRIEISYHLVSADSVLVQTFRSAHGETLSVFHLDGQRLVLTHYCAQGNQPRLQLVTEGSPDRLVFVFFDATNLPRDEASHLRRFELEFEGADHYQQTEIYSANHQDETTVRRFTRKH